MGMVMSIFFLFTGLSVLAALLSQRFFEPRRVPAVVAYLLLGLVANVINLKLHFLNEHLLSGIHILGEMGIVLLLFRVGLQSNLDTLVKQLRKASIVWVGNVTLSGLLGYITAYYILKFPLVASMFIAVALSATSVGITAAVWQSAGRLHSPEGGLLIDVAELDDISAIILMALLFSLVPFLTSGQVPSAHLLLSQSGFLVLKFLAFVGLCFLFSVFVEQHITTFFKSISSSSMFVAVLGITFVVSGLASWLGFSLAIGAIFAGFAFSRDPAEIEINEELNMLYLLFVPFFFINIGLSVKLDLIQHALIPGVLLFVAASIGKFVGAGLPAFFVAGKKQAIYLGISMIPRAEIAMVVMLYGYQSKPQVVSSQAFGAMVMVSLLSCLLVPILLNILFLREEIEKESLHSS